MKKILFMILFSFFITNIYAGYIFTESTDEGDKITYIQKNKFKDVEGNNATLLDVNAKKIYILDNNKKTYYGGTIEELKEVMKKSLDVMIKSIEDSMKNAPKEQNIYMQSSLDETKKMRKSLDEKVSQNDSKKSDLKVIKTNQKEKIAGYNTEKYEIVVNGKLSSEVFIAKDIKLEKELDMKKLIEFQREITMAFAYGEDKNIEFEKMKEIFTIGYPLKEIEKANADEDLKERIEMVKNMGMEVTKEMEDEWREEMMAYATDMVTTDITKVEVKNIPDSEFEIPKNYKKLSFEDMMKSVLGGFSEE